MRFNGKEAPCITLLLNC